MKNFVAQGGLGVSTSTNLKTKIYELEYMLIKYLC